MPAHFSIARLYSLGSELFLGLRLGDFGQGDHRLQGVGLFLLKLFGFFQRGLEIPLLAQDADQLGPHRRSGFGAFPLGPSIA